MIRCHSYAQVDLFTRLSPEDGDDGLRVMAYLMLKTGLRIIEVSRARIEHLQEHVPGEKWKLWVHGKGRASADESVQVLREVYDKIQVYLRLRPEPPQGSDPLFATTVCYDRGGNVVTAAGKRDSPRGRFTASLRRGSC